jgi:uncharacterized protein (DUF4415 family)
MTVKKKKAKRRKGRLRPGKLGRVRASIEEELLSLAEEETGGEARWNRPRKQRISLRVDVEVVDWFKSKGPGYPTRSLDNNALIQPASRQAFARLLAQGWTDAMRKLHPDGPLWTFWDYKFERWQKDKGMRLDHFMLSPNLSDRLVDGGVDRWARGQENASDHAPTWIMLDL